MVKKKLIANVLFLFICTMSFSFPFCIIPHVTFQIEPMKSEVMKMLLNEKYDVIKLDSYKIDDLYVNINLSGLNSGYEFKTDREKIKDNYVKVNCDIELISKKYFEFDGQIKSIEILSENIKSQHELNLSLNSVSKNFYNPDYYSCSSVSKILEFKVHDSGKITMLITIEKDGVDYVIRHDFIVKQKKHIIQLND